MEEKIDKLLKRFYDFEKNLNNRLDNFEDRLKNLENNQKDILKKLDKIENIARRNRENIAENILEISSLKRKV